MSEDRFDVVVVGAGLAGLNAAWRIKEAGKRVLVVEARERVGGRTFTTQIDGQPFDLGAHFIGHELYQSTIWKLVKNLGLETFKQYDVRTRPPTRPGARSRIGRGKVPTSRTFRARPVHTSATRSRRQVPASST